MEGQEWKETNVQVSGPSRQAKQNTPQRRKPISNSQNKNLEQSAANQVVDLLSDAPIVWSSWLTANKYRDKTQTQLVRTRLYI